MMSGAVVVMVIADKNLNHCDSIARLLIAAMEVFV